MPPMTLLEEIGHALTDGTECAIKIPRTFKSSGIMKRTRITSPKMAWQRSVGASSVLIKMFITEYEKFSFQQARSNDKD